MIEKLNRLFGLPHRIRFFQGEGGFTFAELRHRNQGVVTLSLYGAHVVTWKDQFGQERLFVSRKVLFAPGKPIRGGIPVIFPQFGPGPLPSHGFARCAAWECVGTRELADGAVAITMRLNNSPDTEKIWPHQFTAELEVLLHDALTVSMKVENRGASPFSFQNAFHTYFKISHINQVAILGLHGLSYLDSLQGRMKLQELAEKVAIDKEVDRIYLNTPGVIGIEDSGTGVTTQILKQGMLDAVVWNPWIEKSKSFSDLGLDDYNDFVCVESGNIGEPVTLPPGMVASCVQVIS